MPTSKKESASTSAGNKPRVPQLTVAEKKLYEKLKARQQEIEKQEAEARKSSKYHLGWNTRLIQDMCAPDSRKRTTAMAIRDASGDEEEDVEETRKVTVAFSR